MYFNYEKPNYITCLVLRAMYLKSFMAYKKGAPTFNYSPVKNKSFLN